MNISLTSAGTALSRQIRDKIRHYIKLMVEGSNICDIGHRDWAPVPLLSSFIEDCVQHGKDITAGGARYNFSGVQGIGIANLERFAVRPGRVWSSTSSVSALTN